MATKAQGRRSSKLKGYYDQQFSVTISNKQRRAKARVKRAAKMALTLPKRLAASKARRDQRKATRRAREQAKAMKASTEATKAVKAMETALATDPATNIQTGVLFTATEVNVA